MKMVLCLQVDFSIHLDLQSVHCGKGQASTNKEPNCAHTEPK